MYRAVKAILLNRVYEGRAGISHFTRVVRAAFIASFLSDVGHVSELKLPDEGKTASSKEKEAPPDARSSTNLETRDIDRTLGGVCLTHRVHPCSLDCTALRS